MRDCPDCGEPMQGTGPAYDGDRDDMVDTFYCGWCDEDFVDPLKPPPGALQEIRAAVRAYREAS